MCRVEIRWTLFKLPTIILLKPRFWSCAHCLFCRSCNRNGSSRNCISHTVVIVESYISENGIQKRFECIGRKQPVALPSCPGWLYVLHRVSHWGSLPVVAWRREEDLICPTNLVCPRGRSLLPLAVDLPRNVDCDGETMKAAEINLRGSRR